MTWRELGCGIGLMIVMSSPATPEAIDIFVDASSIVGRCDNRLWGNLGFDPLYAEITAERTRPVLRMIRDSRAFRYLRCHNYFSDGLPRQPRTTYFGCRVHTYPHSSGYGINKT